ncbi:MAG: hypothetical protein WAW77_03135, partial [Caldibacillus thermoamylovorans]
PILSKIKTPRLASVLNIYNLSCIHSIDFVLDPYEKPQVFVQYHNRLITKEVAESLGLDKIDY